MLKISVQQLAEETVVVLEGRLVRPWVAEFEKVCTQQRSAPDGRHLTVDLCGLTGTDDSGEALLQALYRRGATLRCADVMNGYLVELIMGGRVKPLRALCRPCQWTEIEAS